MYQQGLHLCLLLYYAYCFVIFSAKTVKIQSLFHISSHIPCKKSSNLFAWNNNGNPRRIKIYKFCGNFPCTFFQKTKLGWGIHCPGNGHKLLHRTTLAGIFFISQAIAAGILFSHLSQSSELHLTHFCLSTSGT